MTMMKTINKYKTLKLRALIESGLVDRGDGTIFDTRTNLLWQQTPSNKKYTWQKAINYCKRLKLIGYADWRLPTIEELKTLINERYRPTIDPILKCSSWWYWSSSTYTGDPTHAWLAGFDDGLVYYAYEGYHGYVRAVHG